MRIVVQRTGGLAGRVAVADVDTSRLDPARAAHIEALVGDAIVPFVRGEEAVGADLMRYEITVQSDGKTRRLSWTDDGRPEPDPVRRMIEGVAGLL